MKFGDFFEDFAELSYRRRKVWPLVSEFDLYQSGLRISSQLGPVRRRWDQKSGHIFEHIHIFPLILINLAF